MAHVRWHAMVRSEIGHNAPEVIQMAQRAVKSENERLRVRGDVVHRVKGGLAFWDDFRADLRARKLYADIMEFKQYLSSENVRPKGVKNHLSSVVDIEHRWGLIEKIMVAADEALRPDHLEKLFAAVNAIIVLRPHHTNRPREKWCLYVRIVGTTLEAARWDGVGRGGMHWAALMDLASGSHP